MSSPNPQHRPLVLVTNDDGVSAKGLRHLAACVPQGCDVYVVAPAQPQSGMSSAITVGAPLHVRQHADCNGARVFSVTGTPVDCVKMALHTLLPRRPDLVLSGINHGSNSGNAVTYSGTMGAVLEGCMAGIPSVGFSLLHHSIDADFSLSTQQVVDIIGYVLAHGLPPYVALNVNIPALVVPRGIRVCRAARGHWTQEYVQYLDPSGQPFYWLTGQFVEDEPEARDTDEHWLRQQYVSVVPVTPEQTANEAIAPLRAALDDETRR